MSVQNASDMVVPRVVRPADVDWVKFDAELARDGSVDPVDKALYAALASFVDQGERDSDPDPDAEDIPTRARLAACIGRSVDTVDRATKRLEERGLLRVERRRDPANPRRHLPSVYELLDHERWDERAAARAQARREARQRKRDEVDRGGRMDAARGSRTGAAVPLLSKKISLSEARAGAREPVAEATERERDESPTNVEQARAEQAREIGAAWTAGTGRPRIPSSERKITDQAAELLAEGHDPAHLASVARWMAGKGWRDLGYALTAPDAPTGLSGPSVARPDWCGQCDESTRQREDDDGRPYRCPTCHPLAIQDPALTP